MMKQESPPAGNRTRHTACRITSLGGYPRSGVPPPQPGLGYPPPQPGLIYPPGQRPGTRNLGKNLGLEYPPPRVWTDKQLETLPHASRKRSSISEYLLMPTMIFCCLFKIFSCTKWAICSGFQLWFVCLGKLVSVPDRCFCNNPTINVHTIENITSKLMSHHNLTWWITYQ